MRWPQPLRRSSTTSCDCGLCQGLGTVLAGSHQASVRCPLSQRHTVAELYVQKHIILQKWVFLRSFTTKYRKVYFFK